MTNPVEISVTTTPAIVPDHNDPSNARYWEQWHNNRADEIVNREPATQQTEQLGAVMGEVDHRAAAMGYREMAEEWEIRNAKKQSQEFRALFKTNSPDVPNQWRDAYSADVALQDLRAAFRDYSIPEHLAAHAVELGELDRVDAASREQFVNKILDAKAHLDERLGDEMRHGANDWTSAILAVAAAEALEKRTAQPVNHVEFIQQIVDRSKAAGADAREAWADVLRLRMGVEKEPKASQEAISETIARATNQPLFRREQAFEQLRKLPGVQSHREASKLMRAGQIRMTVAAMIPERWRKRLGMQSPEQAYQFAVDRSYQKLVDRKADALLVEHYKGLAVLRGVDPNTPPHLLSSEQYRAAEAIIKSEQQLRQLRSLGADEYRSVVHKMSSPAATLEKLIELEQKQPGVARAAQKGPENSYTAAPTPTKSKQEIALESVRKQMNATPTDYQTAAQKTMAERIVSQLQNRAETIQLSTQYQGPDLRRAESTHARAIEANLALVEAVRAAGIPVDTGRATIAVSKKVEVEPSVQEGLDRAMEVLQ